VTSYSLGIGSEDFDIIPPNQDLYCVDPDGTIVKLSHTLLSNYVGDLLVTQDGENFGDSARLFIVHWDGSKFVVRAITYTEPNGSPGRFEHVTFAPINIQP
jgi:hypothetical protein